MARVEEGGEERSAASSLDAPLKAASVSCGTSSSSSSSRTSHLSSTVSAGAAAAARPSSPRSGEAGDCRASSVSAQKPESSLPRSRSGAEGVPLAEGRETESRGSARRVEGGGGVRGAAKAVGARGAESFWRSLGSAGAPGGGGGRVPALLKSALDECVRLNLGGVVAFPSRADTATEKAAASSLTCPVCGCSLAESRESGVAADGLLLTATLFADGRRVSPPTVLCPRPLRAASRAPLLFQRKKTPPVGSTAFAPATSAEEQRLQQQPHQRRLSCYPRPCVHSLVGSPPCCVAPEEAAASAEESGGDEGELSQRQSVAREPPSGGGDEECVCCGGVKTDCLGGLRFASLQQMLQVPSAPLGALSLNAFFVLAVFAHCDDAPAFADSAGDSEETTLAGSGWRLFGFALLSLHDRRGCLRQGRLLLPIHRVLLQVPLLPLCSKRAADPADPSSGKGEGGSASPETPREKLVLFLRRLRDVCAPPSLAGVKGGGIFAEEGEAAASPFSGAGEDFPLSCEALLGLLVRQPQLLHGRQDAEEEDVLSAAASLSFSASPSPPLASCCASERLLPSVQTLALVAEAMRLCVDLDVRQRGVLNRPSAEPVEGAVQRRLQRSLWERLLLLQAEAQTVDDIIVRRLAAAESPTGSPQQGRRQREEAAAALAEATPAVLFGGFLYVELPFYGVPVMHAEERLLAASASNPAAVLESAERGGAFFSADLSSQSAPFVQQPWTLGRPVVPPFWSVSSLSASTQGATQGTLPSAAQQQRLAPVLPAQAARKIHLREMQTELEQRSRRQRQSSSASPQMEGAGPQPAESEKGKGGPRAANSLNWLNSSWGVPPLEGVGPRSASSLPSFQKGKDVCAAAAPAGTENSPLDKPTDLSLPSGGSSFVSAKNEPRRTQQRLLQQLTWQDVSEHPCIAARIQRRIFLCDAANAPSPVFPPFPSGSLAAAGELLSGPTGMRQRPQKPQKLQKPHAASLGLPAVLLSAILGERLRRRGNFQSRRGASLSCRPLKSCAPSASCVPFCLQREPPSAQPTATCSGGTGERLFSLERPPSPRGLFPFASQRSRESVSADNICAARQERLRFFSTLRTSIPPPAAPRRRRVPLTLGRRWLCSTKQKWRRFPSKTFWRCCSFRKNSKPQQLQPRRCLGGVKLRAEEQCVWAPRTALPAAGCNKRARADKGVSRERKRRVASARTATPKSSVPLPLLRCTRE